MGKSRSASKSASIVAAVVVVLGWAGSARAADAVPFFKPEVLPDLPEVYGPMPPHPIATECSVVDEECVNNHDNHALNTALAEHDVDGCVNATDPNACVAAYQMISGTVGMKADAVLDDPCSWVVLVKNGAAIIESKRLGLTRRYVDRGWKPRTFLGACDVSRIAPTVVENAVPMPSWEPRRAPAAARKSVAAGLANPVSTPPRVAAVSVVPVAPVAPVASAAPPAPPASPSPIPTTIAPAPFAPVSARPW